MPVRAQSVYPLYWDPGTYSDTASPSATLNCSRVRVHVCVCVRARVHVHCGSGILCRVFLEKLCRS